MTAAAPGGARQVVAVIGASTDRRKFGNKAVRAYRAQGFEVVPVNPHETEVEGLKAYASVLEVPGPIAMATLYVPAEIGETLLEGIARKGIPEVWVNPGAESPHLLARARALGLRVVAACSILGVGADPAAY